MSLYQIFPMLANLVNLRLYGDSNLYNSYWNQYSHTKLHYSFFEILGKVW